MSAPFGGHPTFAQYLAWAKSKGCTIHSGIQKGPNGKIQTLTKIVAPSGRWVIEVGTDQNEYLVPTQIGYFDRRLGLDSGFFAIDGDDPHGGE